MDADEGRRSREDNIMEIRKNRREEKMQKKGREGLTAQPIPALLHSSALDKKLENLPALVAGVWCDEGNLQLQATTQFRRLLLIDRILFTYTGGYNGGTWNVLSKEHSFARLFLPISFAQNSPR